MSAPFHEAGQRPRPRFWQDIVPQSVYVSGQKNNRKIPEPFCADPTLLEISCCFVALDVGPQVQEPHVD